MHYLQETHFKNTYTNTLKVKGWKMSSCADSNNHGKATVAKLISDKVGFSSGNYYQG